MLIEMHKICKSYVKGQRVLDKLDFSMDAGEAAIIRGASGCGKSTFLNILGLIDSADSGEYLFESKEINFRKLNECQSRLANDIGFVFQSYYLIESISVLDNILLPFLYNDRYIDKSLMDELEKLTVDFGIAHLLTKKAGLLSGGEKQRVAICRAMIKKPKILIADEPTGNLDDRNTGLVLEAMQQSRNSGVALVIVTHNMLLDFPGAQHYKLENGFLKQDEK